MKIIKEEKKFKPVTITLETQDEIDQMFAVFNFSPISKALSKCPGISIAETVRKGLLESAGKYEPWHMALFNHIYSR